MKTAKFVREAKAKGYSFLKFPKIVLAALAFAGLSPVLQAETFPTAGGDISTAEGWDGTLPATDAKVAFEAGTYTASADAAFGVVTNYGSVTFDFTATPDRTITINAATAKTIVFFGTGENGSTCQFKGGTWTFPTGGYVYLGSSDGRNANANRTILFSDGVCFSNATVFTAIDRDYNSTFRMTGGSSIYCTDLFRPVNGSTKNSRAEILDGSTVTARRFFVDAQPTPGGAAVVVVSGANSTLRIAGTSGGDASAIGTHLDGHQLYVTNGAILDMAGYMVEGQTWVKDGANRQSSKNLIYLADNATARVKNLYMGAYVVSNSPDDSWDGHPNGIDSHDNEIYVKSGATLAVTQLFIGADRLSYGNRVVVDGGEITCPDTGLQVGHAGWGNELILTNISCYYATSTATNLLPKVKIGRQITASNNVMRVAGPTSEVLFSGLSNDIFSYGPNCELVIENGAQMKTVDTRWDCFQYCTGCTVRVRSGGLLRVDRTFYVGTSSRAGCANRFVVEDGGAFTNYSGGINIAIPAGCPYPNGFILRNGRADVNGLTIGTGCYAEFGGTNPVLVTTARCTVPAAATLRFVVPKTGYVTVPYTTKKLTIEDGATLDIDISSKPYLDAPMTLVKGAESLVVSASVLAAANEQLGRKGDVYLSADNKNLMLRVWRKGTSVYIR